MFTCFSADTIMKGNIQIKVGAIVRVNRGLTLLHSERSQLYTILAFLSAIELMSHQKRGHTETGPGFKVSSKRSEKQWISFAIKGLVVQLVFHYTFAITVDALNLSFVIYETNFFSSLKGRFYFYQPELFV